MPTRGNACERRTADDYLPVSVLFIDPLAQF